ncbi:unnamed protein product [Cladocopium goreaui]|uniref:RRM domain-containing protein n=1 Tax=Cladocopium goreaui TaxID=2562237 RepID=A0A9P1DXE9_9DINO|nr:unnamed protein product [Cladocopium goreaui]
MLRRCTAALRTAGGQKFFIALRDLGSRSARGWPPRVRLRGLPFGVHEDEIRRCFEGFSLAQVDVENAEKQDVVILRRTRDHLPTGHALVYFTDWEEACRAREEKQRTYIGNRWIEIYVDWSPDWFASETSPSD